MKTRVRQVDSDKWIVEAFESGWWQKCSFELFRTKHEAEYFALYHSKSDVIHAEFENGERIK